MALIRTLRGRLSEKAPAGLVVECGGVGYGVVVPLSTFDRLPAQGEEVFLRIAHVIREDDQLLFGFATERECVCFNALLGVSGVGPKLALSVLSGLAPGELAAAVAGGDVRRLSSISGIGKKTAERIIVELKDKFDPLEGAAGRPAEGEAPDALRDAILSLVALGNRPEEARKMAQAAWDARPGATVQELIRLALRK